MNAIAYGVRDLQRHLGRALDEAKRGFRVVITSRGRPVAMIVCPDTDLTSASDLENKLRRLATQGKLILGTGLPCETHRSVQRGAGLVQELAVSRGRLETHRSRRRGAL